MFKRESTHTTHLVKKCLFEFGPECIEWEPDVILKTVKDTFGSVASVNINKIMSGLSLLQNDRFWHDWHTFHFLAQCLNNLTPIVHTTQELTVAQLMVAVDTAVSLRESLGSISYVPTFSEEVAKFVAARALDEGVWFLPEPLHFASKYASKRMLVCKDCGNEEYLEEEDEMVCPICVEKYSTDSLLEFSADTDRASLGFGQNVEVQEKHPTHGVQKTLQRLLTSTEVKLDGDNPDHVCAAKLRVAIDYLMLRRRQSREV